MVNIVSDIRRSQHKVIFKHCAAGRIRLNNTVKGNDDMVCVYNIAFPGACSNSEQETAACDHTVVAVAVCCYHRRMFADNRIVFIGRLIAVGDIKAHSTAAKFTSAIEIHCDYVLIVYRQHRTKITLLIRVKQFTVVHVVVTAFNINFK